MEDMAIVSLKNWDAALAAAKEKSGNPAPMTSAELAPRIRSIPTGTDTSDATATPAEVFAGQTAYLKDGKQAGTFTIEAELTAQDAKIAALQEAVKGKAGGGDCGPYSKIEVSTWTPEQSPSFGSPKYQLTPEEANTLDSVIFLADPEKLNGNDKANQVYINLGQYQVDSTISSDLMGHGFCHYKSTGPDDPYPTQSHALMLVYYNPVERTIVAGDSYGGRFSIGTPYSVIKFFK